LAERSDSRITEKDIGFNGCIYKNVPECYAFQAEYFS